MPEQIVPGSDPAYDGSHLSSIPAPGRTFVDEQERHLDAAMEARADVTAIQDEFTRHRQECPDCVWLDLCPVGAALDRAVSLAAARAIREGR
jgi:hypothetical protein